MQSVVKRHAVQRVNVVDGNVSKLPRKLIGNHLPYQRPLSDRKNELEDIQRWSAICRV